MKIDKFFLFLLFNVGIFLYWGQVESFEMTINSFAVCAFITEFGLYFLLAVLIYIGGQNINSDMAKKMITPEDAERIKSRTTLQLATAATYHFDVLLCLVGLLFIINGGGFFITMGVAGIASIVISKVMLYSLIRKAINML